MIKINIVSFSVLYSSEKDYGNIEGLIFRNKSTHKFITIKTDDKIVLNGYYSEDNASLISYQWYNCYIEYGDYKDYYFDLNNYEFMGIKTYHTNIDDIKVHNIYHMNYVTVYSSSKLYGLKNRGIINAIYGCSGNKKDLF